MAEDAFNFGEGAPQTAADVSRSQIGFPLDVASRNILREYTKEILPELNRVQAITLKSGDTSFDVRRSDSMSVTASAAVSISTITSGYNGQILTLNFNDANTTLVHSSAGAQGTLNLGGSNFTSAANTTVQLLFTGTYWVVNTVGILSATTGSIGGFNIGADYIRDAANSFGLASTVTGGDDVRFWAGDTFANRATAPFRVTESGAVFMASATISGVVVTSQGTFGGDGSDGALTISSGTTTIDCTNLALVVKNYTSISITGTGTLAFSNPHANGTIVILKSQGNVTLTSSSAPMVDMSSMGAAGAASDVAGGAPAGGTEGTDGLTNTINCDAGDGGGGASGPGGAKAAFEVQSTIYEAYLKYSSLFVGGGGGSGRAALGGDTSGAGGRGGGALVIECNGALNFTTSGGISVKGGNGGNGVFVATGASGGGGGGAGSAIVLYKTLTAASGTITVSGGTGGNNSSTMGVDYYGGGGGGSQTAGNNATHSNTANGKTGGDGGTGVSLIAKNTSFA
jgi:hypothetical protein